MENQISRLASVERIREAPVSYTVITTNRHRQSAVVAASEVDVLSIVKAAEGDPEEAVTVFAEDGRCVSIAELEDCREKAAHGRHRQGR